MTQDSPDIEAGGNDGDSLRQLLHRYLELLRKRYLIIAAVVALGVTLAVLYTMRQPKIYRASASVIIDPQPPQVFGSKVQEVIQLGTGGYWTNQDYYNTQVDILGSYDLAEMTVRRFNLQHNEELVPRDANDPRTEEERVTAATQALAANLKATQNRESRIVNVHITHTNSDLAVLLANRHVDTFLEYTRGLRSEGSGNVSEFLAKELDGAEKHLHSSEQALHRFKEDNDILSVSLEDQQSILAADIKRYTGALSDTRIQRLELESLLARAKKLAAEDVLESPIFGLVRDNIAAEQIKGQIAIERQRLAEIGEEYGPKHPVSVNQQKKVRELEAALAAEARQVVRTLEEKYRATIATEQKFAGELERLKQEAFQLGPKAVDYNRAKRTYDQAEENYRMVVGRLQASELTGKNKEINIRPHTVARDSVLISPRMKANIGLAFMLSLVLGVALALGVDYLDRTVKSAESVERAVGVPVLGLIPVVESAVFEDEDQMAKERDLYVFNHPKSRAAECCRSIRTNILFSSADHPRKRLVISSPRPREGKTTSAIYIGTTMAQSGLRVLLVDTDLRRPRLNRSLGISRNKGLTTILLGESDYEDSIKSTDVPNLYLLPSGPQPPNPAELLHSDKFKAVVEELDKRFDRIIFDSPPLLAVTDGVVLSRNADGVILVVRSGVTTLDDAANAARLLRDVNSPILGVVLNDMTLDGRRYGGYYYGYGYGDSSEAEQPT